MSGKYVKIPT